MNGVTNDDLCPSNAAVEDVRGFSQLPETTLPSFISPPSDSPSLLNVPYNSRPRLLLFAYYQRLSYPPSAAHVFGDMSSAIVVYVDDSFHVVLLSLCSSNCCLLLRLLSLSGRKRRLNSFVDRIVSLHFQSMPHFLSTA